MRTCTVWCVVCSVWCVVRSVWCVVCGVLLTTDCDSSHEQPIKRYVKGGHSTTECDRGTKE